MDGMWHGAVFANAFETTRQIWRSELTCTFMSKIFSDVDPSG